MAFTETIIIEDTSDEEFDRHLEQIRSNGFSTRKKNRNVYEKMREKEVSQSCKIVKEQRASSPVKVLSNGFARLAQTEFRRIKTTNPSLREYRETPRIRWQDLLNSSSDSDQEEGEEDKRKLEKGFKCYDDDDDEEELNTLPMTFEPFEGFRDRNDANEFLHSLSDSSSIDEWKRHSRAIETVRQFRVYRTRLVEDLVSIFNKFVFGNKLPSDLSVSWNGRMTSTAGFCRSHRDKVTGLRSCSIELSPKLLTTADRVRDTIVHELCHAATWIVSEERDCHGPFWSAWARGANLMFSSLPLITRCHNYKKA